MIKDRPYKVSQLWGSLARELVPGGSQTMSKGPGVFPGDYPSFLASGTGAQVEDVDGKIYTDWICGLGTNGLGMSHPMVNSAAIFQIDAGTAFSLPTPLEFQVAEQLVDLIPCAEMVRFTKTGSEACAGAVRIARVATGRNVIVVCGYHGWHDWYAATRPVHPGVPAQLEKLVRSFRYNDTTSLHSVLDNSVAAVIMEPVLHEKPEPGFLAEVARLTSQNGSVLIFDENVTGFRADLRGAQTLYGVTPDLAIFGKAMANGFPLAAVVGHKNLMEGSQYISGTFGGEAVSLAAALETIKIYRATGCIAKMHAVGALLQRSMRNALIDNRYFVDGMPWKPRISGPELNMAMLVKGLADRGHLIHPSGFYVSCVHTEADVASIVLAAKSAQYDDASQVELPKGTAWLRT
jgi:glutamate-1-semialdehyde 2,1-aminomutase